MFSTTNWDIKEPHTLCEWATQLIVWIHKHQFFIFKFNFPNHSCFFNHCLLFCWYYSLPTMKASAHKVLKFKHLKSSHYIVLNCESFQDISYCEAECLDLPLPSACLYFNVSFTFSKYVYAHVNTYIQNTNTQTPIHGAGAFAHRNAYP